MTYSKMYSEAIKLNITTGFKSPWESIIFLQVQLRQVWKYIHHNQNKFIIMRGTACEQKKHLRPLSSLIWDVPLSRKKKEKKENRKINSAFPLVRSSVHELQQEFGSEVTVLMADIDKIHSSQKYTEKRDVFLD